MYQFEASVHAEYINLKVLILCIAAEVKLFYLLKTFTRIQINIPKKTLIVGCIHVYIDSVVTIISLIFRVLMVIVYCIYIYRCISMYSSPYD